MSETSIKNTDTTSEATREAWFDEYISNLRGHEVMLNTKTASDGLVNFYDTLITSPKQEIVNLSRQLSQQYFVSKIILEYIASLKGSFPNVLAFNYNDSEVLVWAEIDTDNFLMEKQLILAEAKINAAYHVYGFDMITTIVESNDELAVPNHYNIYKAEKANN